jgi:ribose 5-phosphate isomerase B
MTAALRIYAEIQSAKCYFSIHSLPHDRKEHRMAKAESIIIGSDHAGYELKEEIKKHLEKLGIAYKDVGAPSVSPTDYPVYISEVASAVSNGEFERGIAIDGIGVGASIVANRYPKVRAALCSNSDIARLSRAHNDANILVLGGWTTSAWHAERILDAWLSTRFEGGRHQRRVALIDDTTTIKIALNHIESLEADKFPKDKIDEQLYSFVVKGIEKLSHMFRSDRRGRQEARLSEACPTAVIFGGQKYAAIMTDLSAEGAQFRLNATNKKPVFKTGDEIALEIKTPYGTSSCGGRIMWIETSFYPSWGIKFTKLSNDKKDPLRSLMEGM